MGLTGAVNIVPPPSPSSCRLSCINMFRQHRNMSAVDILHPHDVVAKDEADQTNTVKLLQLWDFVQNF